MIAWHWHHVRAGLEQRRHNAAPVRVLAILEYGVGVLECRGGAALHGGDGGKFRGYRGPAVAIDHVAVEKQQIRLLALDAAQDARQGFGVRQECRVLRQQRTSQIGFARFTGRAKRSAAAELAGLTRFEQRRRIGGDCFRAAVADGCEAEHDRIVLTRRAWFPKVLCLGGTGEKGAGKDGGNGNAHTATELGGHVFPFGRNR